MVTITEWVEESGRVARSKGFRAADDVHRSLLLIVGEITEAQNELRNGLEPTDIYHSAGGKPEGFPVELADAVLRIFNLASDLGIDFEHVLRMKHEFNTGREAMHGGKAF